MNKEYNLNNLMEDEESYDKLIRYLIALKFKMVMRCSLEDYKTILMSVGTIMETTKRILSDEIELIDKVEAKLLNHVNSLYEKASPEHNLAEEIETLLLDFLLTREFNQRKLKNKDKPKKLVKENKNEE